MSVLDHAARLVARPLANERRALVAQLDEAARRGRGAVTAARLALGDVSPTLDARDGAPEALSAALAHARVELDYVLALTANLSRLDAGLPPHHGGI